MTSIVQQTLELGPGSQRPHAPRLSTSKLWAFASLHPALLYRILSVSHDELVQLGATQGDSFIQCNVGRTSAGQSVLKICVVSQAARTLVDL
jgi:hypothetical protein